MGKEFKNLVFTNHALDRLRLRALSMEDIGKVLSHPDRTFPSEKPDNVKFIRELENRTIHVVASYLKDRKKWLVISVWVRGEEDPTPFVWRVITLPFKLSAKLAGIIWSYINKSK
jgi:hypothetical protein